MEFVWSGTSDGAGGSSSTRRLWRGASSSAHQSGIAVLTGRLCCPAAHVPGGDLVVRRCWSSRWSWTTRFSTHRSDWSQPAHFSTQLHHHLEMTTSSYLVPYNGILIPTLTCPTCIVYCKISICLMRSKHRLLQHMHSLLQKMHRLQQIMHFLLQNRHFLLQIMQCLLTVTRSYHVALPSWGLIRRPLKFLSMADISLICGYANKS